MTYSNGPMTYGNGPMTYSNGPMTYSNGPLLSHDIQLGHIHTILSNVILQWTYDI